MQDYWKEIEPSSTSPSLPANAPPPGVEPPPLLVVDSVPRWLKGALLVAGIAVMFLSYLVSGYGRGSHEISYRIGAWVGGTIIWPLIVLALFSMGARFRTRRNRALILLWVWGVAICGHLATINRNIRAPASPPSPPARTNASTGARPKPTAAVHATAPASAAHTMPASDRAPLDDDFSRGSDQRLIKQIENAQEDRYHAVVNAYALACARRPKDAVLALERLRFIERFAESEDVNIKGADQDREVAREYLTTRFPNAPGTVLYRLQTRFGPQFDAEVNRHLRAVQDWPGADRASFFLLRAQRSNDPEQQLTLARASFQASATAAAGLLMLRHLPKKPPTPETLRVLEHPVFRTAQPWQKLQVMNSLFDVGRVTSAMALYRELDAQSPVMVRTVETVNRLAAAGRIPLARALLAGLPLHDWDRAHVLRERFHFEIEHGTGKEAAVAYRALRATGLAADPLLRERVTLLRKDATAGWSLQDLAGVVVGGVLLLTLLLAPALVLLPVHYWSLLRTRAGKPLASPQARWGLGEAWIVVAAALCLEITCVWLFQPDWTQTWGRPAGTVAARIPAMSDATMLQQQFLAWGGMAIVLAAALWWAQAWNIVRRGEWGWGRTIGLVLATTLVLRITLLGYTAIWPGAADGDFATFSPNTKQLCLALLKVGGPLGMIAVVAGLVPLLEELLFRGVILEGMAKHIPFGWANAAQALLFGAVHENFRMLPFLFVFGVACGWLARTSQRLLAPILVHSLNNLTVCLVLMATYR